MKLDSISLPKALKSKQNSRQVSSTKMQATFFLHVKRANYIASIWKKSNVAKPLLPLTTLLSTAGMKMGDEPGHLKYSLRKLKKFYSTKNLVAMIILMTVGRAVTRKILDLLLCCLGFQCIVYLNILHSFL